MGHPGYGQALARAIITHTHTHTPTYCTAYTNLPAMLAAWLDCMETSGVCLPSYHSSSSFPSLSTSSSSLCASFCSFTFTTKKHSSIIKTLSAAVRNSTRAQTEKGNLKSGAVRETRCFDFQETPGKKNTRFWRSRSSGFFWFFLSIGVVVRSDALNLTSCGLLRSVCQPFAQKG